MRFYSDDFVIPAILVGFALIMYGLWRVTHETPAEKAVIYSAWCQVNDCKNLNQKSWELLRDNGLLPGQVSPDSAPNFGTGLAIGLAAGK